MSKSITYVPVKPIDPNRYESSFSSFCDELGPYPNTELIGGQHTYGEALGIIMVHKHKARIPGDVGNAETFDFPVRYAFVPQTTGSAQRREDPSLIQPFINAAKELQNNNVRAITTCCGFLASYQDDIAKSVDIPVFTSSLLQIPLAYRMAGFKGKVGVITYEGRHLNERYFEAVGAKDIPIVLGGMEDQPAFSQCFFEDDPEPFLNQGAKLNPYLVAVEMVYVAKKMMEHSPDIRSFVLECTQLPPFAYAIQRETYLPIYDTITLCNFVYNVIIRKPFPIKHWFPGMKFSK